jgi:ABC-type Zn uptake system ZnuABC Zn-binding protein ZnuA
MHTATLNPRNAARAAEFLIFLDPGSAVMEDYRCNAKRYVEALKQALTSYQLLLQKSHLVMFSQQTRFKLLQKNLDFLLRYTEYLIQILIPEAQAKLADYLADDTSPRPVARMFFDEEKTQAL